MKRRYEFNRADEKIILEIAHTLQAHLEEWYGKESFLISKTPEVRIFKSSFFLRYPITVFENRKHILVKIRRNSSMYSIAQTILKPDLHVNMRGEYLSLEEIYQFFDGIQNDLGAIRPLAYLEAWHAIVMEEYPSVSLRQLIVKQRSGLQQNKSMGLLLDSAKKAGQWLYAYHHTLHAASRYTELEKEVMQAVEMYTDRLDAISRGKIDTESIKKAFKKALCGIEMAPFFVSTTHGDMTCDNILYSADKKVCAVDVKGKDAPVYTDLGLILVHPETFMLQVFTLGYYFSDRTLRKYRQMILKGYFGHGIKDGASLNLYCSLMLLDKWVTYEDNATRYQGLKLLFSRLLSPLPKLHYRRRIMNYLRSDAPADCGGSPA